MLDIGQVAYEAYCEFRGWKAFNGDPLPHWTNVEQGIKEAWRAAAEAVLRLG